MATFKSFRLPYPNSWGYWKGDLATSVEGSEVHASFRVYGDAYYTWEMHLQRQATDGSWDTIGTRTGYVEWGSPSHRTFTGIGASSRRLKVYIKLWYYGGEYAGAIQSPYFYVR